MYLFSFSYPVLLMNNQRISNQSAIPCMASTLSNLTKV